MIKTIYGIFDKKNASYSTFLFHENENNLVRIVAGQVNSGDRNSFLSVYPEDFTLNKLGTINDETGEVKNCGSEVICELVSLRKE